MIKKMYFCVNIICQLFASIFIQDLFLEASCRERNMTSLDGSFSDAVVTVTFKRLQTYFVVNLVIPTVLLLGISSLTFFIPGEIGEKLSFGVTVTLSLCVNLTIFTDFIPMTSKTFPKLFTYILSSILLSCISLVLATVSVNFVKINNNSKDESQVAAFESTFTNMALKELTNRVCLNKTKKKITNRKFDIVIGFIYMLGVTMYSVIFFATMSHN